MNGTWRPQPVEAAQNAHRDSAHRDLVQKLKFVAVGAASTAIYLAIAIALSDFFPLPVASGLAYFVSASFSYLGQRRFTFRSRKVHRIAVPRFLVVAACGLLLSIAVPKLAAWIGSPPPFAVFGTVVVLVMLFSFVMQKFWVFSPSPVDKRPCAPSDLSGI